MVPLLLAVAVSGRVSFLANDEVRLWSTLFVSICIQALPFLVLGVVISGLIAAFVGVRLRRFFGDVARGDSWESLYERFTEQESLISGIATGITVVMFT